MTILSHRGYWQTIEEKNTIQAFKRSFEANFGVETDIRDFNLLDSAMPNITMLDSAMGGGEAN